MKMEAKSLKFYTLIGKVLLTLAGGIIGLVMSGPVALLFGSLIGLITGTVFDKTCSKYLVNTEN